ncbi:MAG: four helix bundle protein [Elusimicrobia bacterium]|nr:four helix bundle protein [Elusimicrobiota bacterium]
MVYTFKKIKVWQKAHNLVLEIYKLTREFPDTEKFGLVSQLRRSAASIPSNIAEGYKRKSSKDFAHFLNMAESSLEETKYHLLLSHDLEYVVKNKYDNISKLSEEIGRMLNGFKNTIKS